MGRNQGANVTNIFTTLLLLSLYYIYFMFNDINSNSFNFIVNLTNQVTLRVFFFYNINPTYRYIFISVEINRPNEPNCIGVKE